MAETSCAGDELRFDHNTLLNRVPGFQGQRYHSHPYVEDNTGPTTNPGGAALGLVRHCADPLIGVRSFCGSISESLLLFRG
jgi:hypothetical protein